MKATEFTKFAAMTGVGVLTLMLPLQHAFSMPVASVAVQVTDVTGGASAPLLAKMSDSMQVVAQQLFADKDTEAVAAAKEDYQRLLREIGDRVFTGYALQEARLQPGVRTKVTLLVRPWSHKISDAVIDLQFSGVAPETALLLEEQLPGLRQRLAETINGASADAGDWAGGILRRIVRQAVEAELPEFKAAVDLAQENGRTVVQVVVYPVGQLVSGIDYEMRSEAIPNIMLMKLKYKYLEECSRLRGLPVEYVRRHRQELEQRLLAQIMQEREVSDYNLTPTVQLAPGADMGVSILMNSREFRLYFEGYGDIGRDSENLSGKAHLGKLVSPQDEVFGEALVTLDEVHWRYGLGYTRYWGKSGWSYMRRMPVGDNVYKLEYFFGPKWTLRAQHFSGDDRNEFGVRYRVHEFLSVEGVYGGQEFYLRLIGNL